MPLTYDVVGIGNALVDILAHADDAFLQENNIERGIMQLIDKERARELYSKMGPAREISGGSAANTIAGLAMLGHKVAYVSKVRDDQLGDIFAHDICSVGADFDTPRASKDHPHETGRCMVIVSPDGERSMNTYLGVSEFLSPDDIDEGLMAQAKWLYLEGYRFDGPDSHAAFHKAIAATKSAGGKVSATLSDPFCVARHKEAFLELAKKDLDLLFANEHELSALYDTEDMFEALEKASKDVSIVVCTAGAKGAYVGANGKIEHAPTRATKIVDATGAGDLFAAGFFHGLISGKPHVESAMLGCIAAGEIISHIGARPEEDLQKLFQLA